MLLALSVLACAAIWWRALAWLPSLPERYPIHFNARGEPDGWSTSRAAWFLLPAIATVLLVGNLLLGRMLAGLARTAPGLMNIPRKELFVRLSARGREAVLGPTLAFLGFVLLLVELLFLFILEGTGRVAASGARMLPPWPVFVFLGLVFATLPAFLIATIRAVDREAAAEKLVGGVPGGVSGGGAPPAR